HFLSKHQSDQAGTACAVGQDFLEALARIELPGNARQLENIVRNALVHKSTDSPLGLSDLPSAVWQELADQGADEMAERGGAGVSSHRSNSSQLDVHSYLSKLLDRDGWNLARALEHCERLLIESALRLSHGNQSK